MTTTMKMMRRHRQQQQQQRQDHRTRRSENEKQKETKKEKKEKETKKKKKRKGKAQKQEVDADDEESSEGFHDDDDRPDKLINKDGSIRWRTYQSSNGSARVSAMTVAYLKEYKKLQAVHIDGHMQTLKVKELKQCCKMVGAPVSGTKAALIKRLLMFWHVATEPKVRRDADIEGSLNDFVVDDDDDADDKEDGSSEDARVRYRVKSHAWFVG